mgnify:CR=1 FL=1
MESDVNRMKQKYDSLCLEKYLTRALLSRIADRLLREIKKGNYEAIPKYFDRLEFILHEAERKIDKLLDAMEQNGSLGC